MPDYNSEEARKEFLESLDPEQRDNFLAGLLLDQLGADSTIAAAIEQQKNITLKNIEEMRAEGHPEDQVAEVAELMMSEHEEFAKHMLELGKIFSQSRKNFGLSIEEEK